MDNKLQVATTYLLNCNLYLYLLGPAPWAAGLHALLAPHLHHEDKLEQVKFNFVKSFLSMEVGQP